MSFFSDVIGFIAGNEAADEQADAIVEGNQLSNQTLMRMFEESNRLNAPARVAGDRTRDEMMALMGLAPTSTLSQTGVADPASGYVDRHPDLVNAFSTLTPANMAHISRAGYDRDGDGHISREEFGNFHWDTSGQSEGRNFVGTPAGQAGAPPANAFATEGTQDAAYDRFLGGGFNRSMTDVTNNDMDQIIGAYGAGGTAMSGATQGALTDRLARNRNNAFTQHWNALGGMSGQATQVAAQQGQQGLNVGQQIGTNQADSAFARGSSYAQRNLGLGNLANSGMNAFATWFGGQ